MTDPTALRALAARLRALEESSPTRPEDLDRWYVDAEAFRQYLATAHAELDLPHSVWHYLSDADIRVKDADYRARDSETIQRIIATFERGEVPHDTSTSLPWRWVVIVLVVLLATYLAFKQS